MVSEAILSSYIHDRRIELSGISPAFAGLVRLSESRRNVWAMGFPRNT